MTERKTLTGLHPYEYEHPFDAKALDSLRSTPGLDTIVRQYNKQAVERIITVQYTGSVCWGRSLTLTFRFPSSPDTRTVDRCKALSVFNRTTIPSEVPQLPCHGNTLPHRENALHPLNV